MGLGRVFGSGPGARQSWQCVQCVHLCPSSSQSPWRAREEGGCSIPCWIWGFPLVLGPLEPQGSLNACSASCSQYSPPLCQTLTWEVPQGTVVTTKPLPVPFAGRFPSVPTLAHCPGCPRAVPPLRWPWAGAGGPWPGTGAPRRGLSPLSSAQSSPISFSGKH